MLVCVLVVLVSLLFLSLYRLGRLSLRCPARRSMMQSAVGHVAVRPVMLHRQVMIRRRILSAVDSVLDPVHALC